MAAASAGGDETTFRDNIKAVYNILGTGQPGLTPAQAQASADRQAAIQQQERRLFFDMEKWQTEFVQKQENAVSTFYDLKNPESVMQSMIGFTEASNNPLNNDEWRVAFQQAQNLANAGPSAVVKDAGRKLLTMSLFQAVAKQLILKKTSGICLLL